MAARRLRAAGADPEKVLVYPCDDLDTEAGLHRVVQAMVNREVDFCVVDSHASWFQETANGPAVRQEIRAAFQPLLTSGCTPGLICHWRKTGLDDGDTAEHKRVSGNLSGLVGSARAVLSVVRLDHDRIVRIDKCNDGKPADDLHFEIGTAPLPYIDTAIVRWGDATPPAPTSGGRGGGGPAIPSDDALVDALDKIGEPATANQIMKHALGMKDNGQPKGGRVLHGRVVGRLKLLAESGRLGSATRKAKNRRDAVHYHILTPGPSYNPHNPHNPRGLRSVPRIGHSATRSLYVEAAGAGAIPADATHRQTTEAEPDDEREHETEVDTAPIDNRQEDPMPETDRETPAPSPPVINSAAVTAPSPPPPKADQLELGEFLAVHGADIRNPEIVRSTGLSLAVHGAEKVIAALTTQLLNDLANAGRLQAQMAMTGRWRADDIAALMQASPASGQADEPERVSDTG